MYQQPYSGATGLQDDLGYVGDEEVCALLDITAATLANRRSAGTAPPSYKVGHRRLTKRAELDAWIKRQRRTGGR